jgi:hypothetical protein
MATFFNQATLTYRGGATNSNIVTGEIREVLSANKTASSDTYTQDPVTGEWTLIPGTTVLQVSGTV